MNPPSPLSFQHFGALLFHVPVAKQLVTRWRRALGGQQLTLARRSHVFWIKIERV